MKSWLLGAGLLLPVLLVAQAGAVTCTLEARTVQLRDGEPVASEQTFATVNPQTMYMRAGQAVGSGREFAEAVKKEPEYRCETPCKGVLKVGEGRMLVALDTRDGTGSYDTIYLDRNGNLDLSDDEPVARSGKDFPLIEIEAPDGQGTFTWALRVETYDYDSRAGGTPYRYVRFRTATYREGTVQLDGRDVRIVLLDYNSNGRYDDETTVDPKGNASTGLLYARTGDHMLVDPEEGPPVYRFYFMTSLAARQPISKLVCINGKCYECSVAPSGATIELLPLKQPAGSLAYDAPRWQMLLLGDAGIIKVMGEGGRPAPVPAGEWKLVEYTAYYGPSQARRLEDLTLIAAHGAADASPITVQADKTTAAPCGGPYQLDVVASRPNVLRGQPKEKGPVPVNLTLRIAGRAGDVCNNMLVAGERPPKPTFVIATAGGKKVESGAFEYG